LVQRLRQEQISILGSHVSLYSPGTRAALEGLRRAFVSSGSDPVTAAQQAHAAVWGMVQRQAVMISYIELFRLLAVFFLLAIPLVLLLEKPAHQTTPARPSAD
jgi:MFS transporter, DHA2 family, multidrug resistance protein